MNKQVTIQMIKMLNNLDGLLVKATQHADAKKFDVNNFLNERIAVDMLPFVKQIQITCDNAKLCVARLAHVEAPKFEDNEKTMGELRTRIQSTVEFLNKHVEADYSKFKSAKFAPAWMNGQWMEGEDYFYQFAIPNFYFHLTAAYAILRKCGLEIGKADFMGHLPFKK